MPNFKIKLYHRYACIGKNTVCTGFGTVCSSRCHWGLVSTCLVEKGRCSAIRLYWEICILYQACLFVNAQLKLCLSCQIFMPLEFSLSLLQPSRCQSIILGNVEKTERRGWNSDKAGHTTFSPASMWGNLPISW